MTHSQTNTGSADPLLPKGYSLSVSELALSTLAVNILSLALPVMTLQVYDRILPNPGSGTLPVLFAGVCVAVVLETLMRIGRAYAMGRAGAAFEHRLSCNAMDHLLKSDLASPPQFGVGEYMNRLSAIGRIKDFYNGYSLNIYLELAFIPVFLFFILYIAGPLVVVPVVVLMVFTVISYAQGRKLRSALQRRDDNDDKRYDFLIESLEGIHSIKSFGLENIFTRKYEALEEESAIANFRATDISAKTFDIAAVFSNIMIAGIIGLGAWLVLDGTISMGALIASILLSGRIMQPVQRALALWTKYQDYVISRKKVESIFEFPFHYPPPSEEDKSAREGTLSIDNVSFRRSENHPLLLKDISLSLKFGDCVSISAANDSSLSALLDMIAGLYAPTSGYITVDGQNILRYKTKDLINHVGYIQSEGVIFRGTIRENITCFGLIPEEKVREMASIFQIDRDISALPAGFDTYLYGNHADNVPPGLKQRISMVRTLATKPRIILFDNADRSLDRHGYNLVYNLLSRLRGKATLIISSDDYNLTAQASRHFIIQDGILIPTTPRSTHTDFMLGASRP